MNAAVISRTPHAVPPHRIASRALGFCNENATLAGFMVVDPQEDNPKIGARRILRRIGRWSTFNIMRRLGCGLCRTSFPARGARSKSSHFVNHLALIPRLHPSWFHGA